MPKPKRKQGFSQLFDSVGNAWLNVWTLAGRDISTPANMPASIIILGQHYRVRYHTNIFNAPKKGQALRGVVIYSNRLIILDPTQTIHEMRETLYHEAGHIYLKDAQTRGISLNKISYTQMEDFCNLFGYAIYDLNLNNPVLK